MLAQAQSSSTKRGGLATDVTSGLISLTRKEKILKDKNFQQRIPYPAKISFRYDGEIITIPDKQKLREFIATRPPLQEVFKKALKIKRERGYKALSKEENR